MSLIFRMSRLFVAPTLLAGPSGSAWAEVASGLSFQPMGILRAGLMALLLPGPSPAWGGDLSGVRGFPRDLLRGFREELRPEGFLTLLAAGAGAGIVRYGKTTAIDDVHVAGALRGTAPLGPGATDVGAVIGYPGYLLPVLGTTYVAGWFFDAGTPREFGLLGVEALSLAGIQTLILKVSVHRLRPDTTDFDAFPSGHTSASFSLATVGASRWGWTVGVPAFLLAGFVGYTRMESQRHYLSDVLFGAGVGIASGRAVCRVRRRARPDRYAFAPFVAPGGGGVMVNF